MQEPSPRRITGTLVRQHVLQLSRTLGEPVVERAIAHLRAEDAQALRQVSALSWVPVRAIEALYNEVAQHTSKGAGQLHWEVGRACTADTLRTLWRMLLRFTSDEALVMRTPVLYAKTYDTGRLEATILGDGEARLVLTGWPDAPVFVRRGLCIGITTVLEVAGRHDVKVREEPTRDGAVFQVRWNP